MRRSLRHRRCYRPKPSSVCGYFLEEYRFVLLPPTQHKIQDQTNIFISWERLKAFFYQSLGKSKAFVNTIWSTTRKNSQHQLKEVIDWVAYLEHLQTVLCKFNANAIISEPVLIRLFCNGLRLSIRAQAKQKSGQKHLGPDHQEAYDSWGQSCPESFFVGSWDGCLLPSKPRLHLETYQGSHPGPRVLVVPPSQGISYVSSLFQAYQAPKISSRRPKG